MSEHIVSLKKATRDSRIVTFYMAVNFAIGIGVIAGVAVIGAAIGLH
jgi:hypothetical protein